MEVALVRVDDPVAAAHGLAFFRAEARARAALPRRARRTYSPIKSRTRESIAVDTVTLRTVPSHSRA